jgi:hypothetical protein
MWVPSVLIMAAVVLSSSTAGACIRTGSWVMAPLPGAKNVPTNARILVGDQWEWFSLFEQPPELLGPDGPVDVESARIHVSGMRACGDCGADSVLVLVPRQPLRPNTRYEVLHVRLGGCSREPWTFTTAQGPDLRPPGTPSLRKQSSRYEPEGEASFDTSSVKFAVEGLREEILVVSVDGFARFEGAGGRASEMMVTSRYHCGEIVNVDREVVVTSGCGVNFGETFDVRAAAMDLAGNLSAWSPRLRVTMPLRTEKADSTSK